MQYQISHKCANDILNCFRELEDSLKSKYAVEDETFVLFEQPNSKSGGRVWKRPQQASAKMAARKTMVLIAYTANKRFSVKALPYGTCLDSDLYIDFLKSTGNKWRTLRAVPIKLSKL